MTSTYQPVAGNDSAVNVSASVEPCKKRQQKLSRRLFFLTAYSLSSAALMGSAVGLVVYQCRQLLFLYRSSQMQFIQPHFDSTSPSTELPSHFATVNHDGTIGEIYDAHYQGHHGRNGHHGHGRHHLRSVLISTWLPVLIWLSAMLTTSIWMTSRRWFSKYLSAKRGIQLSQWIFYAFWILIAATEEVQKELIQLRKSTRGVDPVLEAMEDTNSIDISFEVKSRIRAMVPPLAIMTVVAVAALGFATGLLTASSTVMERELQKEYQETEDQLLLEEGGLPSFNDKNNSNDTQEKKELSTTDATTTCTQEQQPLSTMPRYTRSQIAKLSCLILGLLLSQMKVFQWVIQSEARTINLFGSFVSVSDLALLLGPNVCVAMFIVATISL
ncbi:hypothetical protein BGZ83_011263 [Gryganskiella cystojenkinii]|nr:hypothetical protein BGZ83_011263 [Gryganskiella cystojenkinii]